MSNLFDLTGKNALITGSSKGIGKAIAERMAEHGANVVISSRKADVCKEVADEINAKGNGKAVVIPCNITHKEELEKLVQETKSSLGHIDILVCNAAVNPYFGPSVDQPDDTFEKTLRCNIQSNHWLCGMVAPDMIERKDGSIMIISSVGGLKGSIYLGTYAITKAADMQMARNLACEWGPHNVRVNSISPGLVRTNFARALWENPDILKQSTATAPLRRIGEPDELAGIAIYLGSQAGSFTTGQNFVVDGGATIS